MNNAKNTPGSPTVPFPPNEKGQAQPPEADVACNDDVRVFIVGQLPGAAAVACTVWFGDLFQII